LSISIYLYTGPSEGRNQEFKSLKNRLKIDKRFQIGFHSNLKMPHKRKNENLNHSSSQEIDKMIESLIPMDMWLYEFGKRLFQARWNFFKTGIYIQPNHPPYPDIRCWSTHEVFNCTNDKYYGNIFYNKTTST